jgi:uncharacterized hydrophobic protein (TIGR00271 family)
VAEIAESTIPSRDAQELLRTLEGEIGFGRPYFALAAASCAIATLGLLENSAAVIIGAMLIAPLMTPIVTLALALVSGRFQSLRLSLAALASGAAASIVLSAAIAAIVRLPIPGSEILGRSQPNLLDLGIALAAGAIAGYARVRRSIASSVGGAAIAVALMPPLCVVGIGSALRDWELAYGALLLFATNLIGITLACAIVFVLSGFATRSARGGLATTTLILAVIAIPLAFATARLIEQQQLETGLRRALVEDTQTFKRVDLLSTNVDWLSNPISVRLLVRAQGLVTPTQVAFLQAFAARAMRTKRALRLIVDVTPVTIVQPADRSSALP